MTSLWIKITLLTIQRNMSSCQPTKIKYFLFNSFTDSANLFGYVQDAAVS